MHNADLILTPAQWGDSIDMLAFLVALRTVMHCRCGCGFLHAEPLVDSLVTAPVPLHTAN